MDRLEATGYSYEDRKRIAKMLKENPCIDIEIVINALNGFAKFDRFREKEEYAELSKRINGKRGQIWAFS